MHPRMLWAAVFFCTFSARLVLAQGTCSDLPSDSDRTQVYRIWTGPAIGYYHQVGHALAAASRHEGLQLVFCPSDGSVANIIALTSHAADFAIVQSDAAHRAWYGELPFQQPNPRVKLVAPLFTEKVQILTRPHLYITPTGGFRMLRKVWVGPHGSGSEVTALAVLQASGMTLEDAKALEVELTPESENKFEGAVKHLKIGDLDAIFQTHVAPAENIKRQLDTTEIRLLGLSWDSVETLVSNGLYMETSLQKTDYPELDSGLYTVGVEALLLTHDGVDEDAVQLIAKTLRDERRDLEAHLKRILLSDKDAKIDANAEPPVTPDPPTPLIDPVKLTLLGTRPPKFLMSHVDSAVLPYLWQLPIRKDAFVQVLLLIAALTIIIGAGLLHSGGRRIVGQYSGTFLFLLACLITWMIGAVWLQAVEGGLNQQFTTLRASSFALAENVGAKLQLPLQPLPTPTTRQGTLIMSWFSWIGFLLLTVFLYPLLKKIWQNPPHLILRRLLLSPGENSARKL